MPGLVTTFGAIAADIPWYSGDLGDLVVFTVGWTCGWLLLWRSRPLPPADSDRDPVAVIVPARDEAAVLSDLVPPLVGQLRSEDELVVVDDHSTDGTADLARSLGAAVTTPPPLPDGWLGKPHACWHGIHSTEADVLVFLDADVRPSAGLLDRLATAVEAHPADVVSVQPWHETETPVEQLSLLCNVTALMGSGAFTPLGSRVPTRVGFGPVIAMRRDRYEEIGGHADPVVRRMHTEDIGLARSAGRSRLYTGRPDVGFRMYPGGLRDLVRGWTRSIATGARYAPWWAALATLAWVTSLAGGWLAAPIVYPLSALQFWVLGRRAGAIHPVTALLYPVAVAVFVVIFVSSLFALVTRRDVRWKGRSVPARNAD